MGSLIARLKPELCKISLERECRTTAGRERRWEDNLITTQLEMCRKHSWVIVFYSPSQRSIVMKSTFRLLIVIVLMLGVFGQYTTASAAEMYKWKGPGADAYFSSWDESGCVATDVSVFTRDETFQNPPGKPSKNSFVYLTLYQYDYCANME